MITPQWSEFDPDLRSPRHLLTSIIRRRFKAFAALLAASLIGFVANGLVPILVGATVSVAVEGTSVVAAVVTLTVVIATAILTSWARFVLHQNIRMWVDVSLTTRIGALAASDAEAFARAVAPGKVATIISSDTDAVGGYPAALARTFGSVVAFVVVAGYLISKSALLGTIVLIGVPMVFVLLPKVIGPLEQRQSQHRDRIGELAELGSDIAQGLRVLRGVGGERAFARRYRELSARVQAAGLKVSHVFAVLHGAQVLLPGVFLVGVTWLGARLAMAQQIDVGELIAFYACATYLVLPIQAIADFHSARVQARVGAQRIISVLDTKAARIADPLTSPQSGAPLHDPGTGVHLHAGELTAVVAEESSDALAQQMVGLSDSGSWQWGHAATSRIPSPAKFPRMVLMDGKPHLFSGCLRDDLDPDSAHSDDHLWNVLATVVADEIVLGIDGGLNADIHEAGLNLSGGQRQRLALARAINADPDVLVLVEPTNALDATTETTVVAGVAHVRQGRTTIVVGASVAWQARADRVVDMSAATTVADTHRDLPANDPHYRQRFTPETDTPC